MSLPSTKNGQYKPCDVPNEDVTKELDVLLIVLDKVASLREGFGQIDVVENVLSIYSDQESGDYSEIAER